MSKPQRHKVWNVQIGSALDAAAVVGQWSPDGRRHVNLQDLPVRVEYLIEAKGQGTVAKRRALKMAAEAGIQHAVVLGLEWINR